MGALLFIAGLTGLLVITVTTFLVVGRLTDSSRRLTTSERKELRELRLMRDELLMKAVENIEIEPFAVEVLNNIREHQRSIKGS